MWSSMTDFFHSKFPSCCVTYQDFIPLCGQVIFHRVALSGVVVVVVVFTYFVLLFLCVLSVRRQADTWVASAIRLFRTRGGHSRAGSTWTFVPSSLGCYTQGWDRRVVWKLCVRPEQPPNPLWAADEARASPRPPPPPAPGLVASRSQPS